MKKEILELIDYLLDCVEFPQPGEYHSLPDIDNEPGIISLRDYAKQEIERIFKNEKRTPHKNS